MTNPSVSDQPDLERPHHRFGPFALRATLIGFLVIAVLGFSRFAYVSFRIHQIDDAFSEVKNGDHSSTVMSRLGKPDSLRRGSEMSWLSLLPKESEERCSLQYFYTVETFFLPITWLVYFDEDHRVIMKHRLD